MNRASLLTLVVLFLAGCVHLAPCNNGQMQVYDFPAREPAWILDGKPLVFNGEKYFPISDYEILKDSEVYEAGKYRGVQIFVEKIAAKPYPRLYTKFDKNKFRYWERKV